MSTKIKILSSVIISICIVFHYSEKSQNFVNKLNELKPLPLPIVKTPNLILNTGLAALAPFKAAKNILFFTSYFDQANFEFGFGQQPFFDFGCPVTNCYTTNNKSLLGKYYYIVLFLSRYVYNKVIYR
jgi:hypothetical protein